MTTYKDLQAQIDQLQREAREAHANELSAAIAEIRSLMNEFSITVEDLEGRAPKQSQKPQSKGQVKFRDGENTWSGRGRMPRWLDGKNKEKYRVG